MVSIQSISGPHFPEFGLNTEIFKVNLCIQFKCGKVRYKTSKRNTFHAADERRVCENSD